LVPTEVLNTLKKKKLLITEGLTVLYWLISKQAII
jgi:hypothetical protein